MDTVEEKLWPEVTVSLQGSLETFQLPDVLVLLASTKKTGELRISGDRTSGKVWVKDGQLVQTDVPRAPEPVDAIWELLRLKSGDFTFDSDTAAPNGGKAEAIEPVLADAQARMTEWVEIEKVVPSMAAWVTLAAEAPRPEVTITAEQWKLFAQVGDGRTVEALMDKLAKSEFETCKWLKTMADDGVLVVDKAAPAGGSAAKSAPAKTESKSAAKADEVSEESKDDDDGGPEAILTGEDALLRPAKSEKGKVKISASANATSSDEKPSPAEADALVAQLAALTGGDEEQAAAAIAAAKAKGEEVPVVEDGEQINRGLLLKFLSSVRS